MKKIIIILFVILLAIPLHSKQIGNNVTVIVNYDKNNNNRIAMENVSRVNDKKLTRLKLRYFGIGFSVGGFTVCAATMLTIFFAGRK